HDAGGHREPHFSHTRTDTDQRVSNPAIQIRAASATSQGLREDRWKRETRIEKCFRHAPTVIRRIACAAKCFAEQCVNLIPKRAWRIARARISEIEFVEYNNPTGLQKFQQMANGGS